MEDGKADKKKHKPGDRFLGFSFRLEIYVSHDCLPVFFLILQSDDLDKIKR